MQVVPKIQGTKFIKGELTMFYLKSKNEKIEIRSDNVFAVCDECGEEIQIDLRAMCRGISNLETTGVRCHKCSVEWAKAHPDSPFAEQLLKEG